QPFDLLIEQVAEFVQLGSAKRCKKRRGTVVADDGAVIASIENGDTKRHVETRANIDGDDLVGDYWIADEIEQAALHLAGERSHHALIGARDNHEAMHPADPLDLLLNLAPGSAAFHQCFGDGGIEVAKLSFECAYEPVVRETHRDGHMLNARRRGLECISKLAVANHELA